MRAAPLAALALWAGCVRDAPTPIPAARESAGARPVAPAAAALKGAADPWLATADSVLRVHLARQLFFAAGGYAPDLGDCSDDEGSDNPTLQVAAVAARPIANAGAAVDSGSEYPYVVKQTTYKVEVRSVAIMVPQWIARVPVDTAQVIPVNTELYAADVAPRVDTFSITLHQIVGWRARDADLPPVPNPKAHWTVCDPAGPAVSEGDGPGFRNFLQGKADWMTVLKWTPANANWERVVALADSARRAPTSTP